MGDRLAPGAVIGILGGGQLGRMLSVAAARLGLRTHIYEPKGSPCAGHVADRVTTARYDDLSALEAWAISVDVITYEFENIPADALDAVETICPIRPNRTALATSQDRLVEKDFLNRHGLPTAPYVDLTSREDLIRGVEEVGTPCIVKTRRFGYDGKGQIRITDPDQIDAAWDALAGRPAVLEGFVDFDCEISVIGARGLDGRIACYEPGRNVHRDGILRTTTIPSGITDDQRRRAIEKASTILEELDYVGVIGVEFFVSDDTLLVNEFAPRVHNSGHWTQNGCAIDQFEQHIRAIAGWPLGDGRHHANVRMCNLIGDEVRDVARWAEDPRAAIHLYGKADVRGGRKMGHVNELID